MAIDSKCPHEKTYASVKSVSRINPMNCAVFQPNINIYSEGNVSQANICNHYIYINQRIRSSICVIRDPFHIQVRLPRNLHGIFSSVNMYVFTPSVTDSFLFTPPLSFTALRVYNPRILFGYTPRTPTWVAYPRKPGSLFVLVVSGCLLIYQMCTLPISRSATL